MAIAVAPGSVVSITLDAGNQVFIKGTGIYRVSMINGSSAPAADNSISTGGSFVGPYQSSASITVLSSGPCEYEEYAAQNPTTTRPQYFLGTFASQSLLAAAHPPATAIGADALVSGVKYYSDGASWIALEAGSTASWASLSDKATANLPTDNAPLSNALAAKQATLVSGSNIKTINGNSLLGSGNLVISGGGGSTYPEALNFSALPSSPAEGTTYVVLQPQGVYFVNRKPAGLYRYTSGAWVYLGEVPDGYFTDNVLRFFDNGDPTKQLAFELSGISTGTTRTLTVPDASGTIALTSDTRFTDAREWTAATIDQAEAEAGTSTTRRAWTAQRVWQAITKALGGVSVTNTPTTGQVLKATSATTAAWGTDETGGGGGGSTNLSYTASSTGGVVASDTGTDATLPLADGTNAGLMAPAQHTKLAGIAAGATANATDAQLRDRATHTGAQPASTITVAVEALTGAKTLAAADAGKTFTLASTQAITVPAGLGAAWGCALFDGACTFVADGTTVTDNRVSGAGFAQCALVQIGANAYRVVGTSS